MSLAGLSNLGTLKRHLLPGTMLTDTQFDATITQLGLGVAASMEKFCNRKFVRDAAAVCEFTGDRYFYTLPLYPIESITSIEYRTGLVDAYAAQTVTGVLVNRDYAAGLLQFGTRPGTDETMVRVTWVGGYFFEQLETDAGGYPTATPAGSTALAKDLQTAWLLQCEAVWTARDRLGAALVAAPKAAAEMELTASVKQMLNGHVRYQMT